MSDAAILLDLTRRYTEPHRRYHTIEHIADMLWSARKLRLEHTQILAIWYHDAIYRIPSDTNEEDSAALAVEQLAGAGYDPEFVKQVETIVLDTKTHTPSIDASRDVIDLDLASLAYDWDRFRRNTSRIRKEYVRYTDDEFRAGQREVFEGFLARPRIYWTEWGALLETEARANLQRAVEQMRSDRPA